MELPRRWYLTLETGLRREVEHFVFRLIVSGIAHSESGTELEFVSVRDARLPHPAKYIGVIQSAIRKLAADRLPHPREKRLLLRINLRVADRGDARGHGPKLVPRASGGFTFFPGFGAATGGLPLCRLNAAMACAWAGCDFDTRATIS